MWRVLQSLSCRALQALRRFFRRAPHARELLGIKTSAPGRWQSRDPRAEKDLAPRTREASKFAWAHELPDTTPFKYVLAGDAASGILQAAALLLFDHVHKQDRAVRLVLHLVSVQRAVLPDDAVTDEAASHPVARFDCTHREVQTADPGRRRQIFHQAIALGSADPVDVRSYSREQLIPLLEHLVLNGHLRFQFDTVARRIIGESAAKR